MLEVQRIEFYPSENAKNHHTDKFELVTEEWKTPVLRRGQTFFMSIITDKEVKIGIDSVVIIFEFGQKLAIELPLKSFAPIKQTSNEWSLDVYRQNGSTLILEVFIPPQSCVGQCWRSGKGL